jgi:UDP-4-keto-D-FucNAc 4-reductase
LSTGELVRCLGEGMGRVPFLLLVPSGLALVVAKVMGKDDLYRQLFGSLVVRNDKAKDVLGWVPIESAKDSLAKVGRWFQDNKVK